MFFVFFCACAVFLVYHGFVLLLPSALGVSLTATRRFVRRCSPSKSIRLCGRRGTRPRADVVGDTVSLAAVQFCGSPWVCPDCSRVIRARRADTLSTVAGAHCASGGALSMATLTVRHNLHQSLSLLLDAVSSGWTAVRNGVAWRRDFAELGLVGYVRALEVTYGANGWHPHLHVLLFWDRPVGDATVEHVQGALLASWSRGVGKVLEALPSVSRGVDHRLVDSHGAAYLAKAGFETVGIGKASLVSQFASDNDVSHFREFDKSMKGRRSIVSSKYVRGLMRDMFLSDDESVDEVVLDEGTGVGGDDLRLSVSIDPHVWFAISGDDYLLDGFIRGCKQGIVFLDDWYLEQVALGALPRVHDAFLDCTGEQIVEREKARAKAC